MIKECIISLKFLLVMSFITGIMYPLLITILAQSFFPHQAMGSLIKDKGKNIGSALIGQNFKDKKYFWGRPSASDYASIPSGASNMAVTNKALKIAFEERKKIFIKENELSENTIIPSEMLFASASGLDPHVSPESIKLQFKRVIKARNFNKNQEEKLLQEIEILTEKPTFGLLGENRINVLLLNKRLDGFFSEK
ncbi:MAG: potassium-transporting ATPase subunit KdpC [Candidatus Sericytochromatia bacterium]